MKEYDIIVKIEDEEMEVHTTAKDWQEVCDYVFGNIEIIPKNEKSVEIIDIDE